MNMKHEIEDDRRQEVGGWGRGRHRRLRFETGMSTGMYMDVQECTGMRGTTDVSLSLGKDPQLRWSIPQNTYRRLLQGGSGVAKKPFERP